MSAAERDHLLELINASWTTQAIGAFVRLGAARALVSTPGSTSAALAEATATHEPSLVRLLCALATLGLVEQDLDGRWQATATGRLLDADAPGSLAAWAEFCAGMSWTTWGHLDESVRSGQSHRARSGVAGFAHLDADADAARLFNRAMRELTGPIADAFVERVDLCGATTIVDVGGGVGELAAALLVRHPSLRAVVFDLEHARAGAMRNADERGVGARMSFASGDFFVALPAAADAYLLKSVLHDWGDADCVRILRSVGAALPPNGRVFVIERLVPRPPGTSAADRMVARSDLNMLVGPGGRERTEEEFAALLGAAGLAAAAATPLVPTYWASIEARKA
jgi:hypothetical protein